MALGNLLRRAATAADSATEAVGGALSAAKERAGVLANGDNAEVYDGALSDVNAALSDAGLMTQQISGIINLLVKANPHK